MDKHGIGNIHWQLDMLQTIDVGLVVVDRDYSIKLWNGFMANHSGLSPTSALGRNLFELFPDIAPEWFKRKAESVFLLKNRSFCHWEQRPYLFRFKPYRPITGIAEFMYQNITLIPISSADGRIDQLGIIVYDVTDTAVGKRQLRQANEQLARLSRTDSLTQLNNRGYWEQAVAREYLRTLRTGSQACLVMFDIDHFKRVNDEYGHPAGDAAIRRTAQMLNDTIRATDIAGRYGGEEFGIVLVDTDTEGARVLTERLRKAVETMTVEHEQQRIRFTISLGIAPLRGDLPGYEQWIARADQALYQAKQAGRNRVVIFQVPAHDPQGA